MTKDHTMLHLKVLKMLKVINGHYSVRRVKGIPLSSRIPLQHGIALGVVSSHVDCLSAAHIEVATAVKTQCPGESPNDQVECL